MIITALLFNLTACPTPLMVYRPGTTESELDKQTLVSGQKGCRKYYGTISCLKKLVKTGDRSYHAICFTPSDSNSIQF